MNIINEFKLTVSSKSVNEGFCRTVVSAFASQLDPTIEELSDLKTAVSEAVTNSIVHGYMEREGKIYITAQITENSTIKIKIRDMGVGIENVPSAMQPLYTTLGGDRAGLGFTVMQSFCDRVGVTSHVGRGTTVTLTKRIYGKSKW
ncbi:MAG: anti-sigma F factor [Eubacterium sp.]|nr:anti-sigma F factor [Eubacterium sp.]MBR0412871.1 anti-sigma F factor [Eubacterium sp.]